MEGLCRLLERCDVVRHRGVVRVAERGADGAVDVDVQDGAVALVGAHADDALAQPLDIGQELFAVCAELRLDVVDQRVRQNGRALDDHLVGVVVAVIAGLREDGDGMVADGAAVLVGHDLAHLAARRSCDRVQKRLRDAVADGGVQALAIDLDLLHHLCKRAEVVRFLADELWLDVLLDDRNEVLGKEQRVASARAGILHGGAVAVSDLTVFEDDHDRDRLARLTDGRKAIGDGLSDIEHAVMTGALLDGALIVEVETGTARCADNIFDLHYKFPPVLSSRAADKATLADRVNIVDDHLEARIALFIASALRDA